MRHSQDPESEAFFDPPSDGSPEDPRDYDDEVPPEMGGPLPAQTIASEEHAAEIVDRIMSARARYERIKASCALMVARAKADAEAVEWVFVDSLRVWAAAQVEGGKRKSVALPTGQLRFRDVPARYVVTDPGAVQAWAAEHLPEAVRPELLKTPVLEHVKRTGEIPPGVSETEPTVSFTITGAK